MSYVRSSGIRLRQQSPAAPLFFPRPLPACWQERKDLRDRTECKVLEDVPALYLWCEGIKPGAIEAVTQ